MTTARERQAPNTSEIPPQTPEQHATYQAMKNVARRILVEVIDGMDMDAADELIAEDYVEHRSLDGKSTGRAALKDFVRMIHKAFPDWRHDLDDVIAEGDKVMIRNTLYATHRGEFMGIAPTGKQVAQPGFDLFRIKDGKMVEHWGEYDWLGFFRQLGTIPDPPSSA